MRKIAVLCDFDGTIARDDVGNLLFTTFSENGDSKKVVDQWRRGEISSRQCLEQEAALVKVDRNALNEFVRHRQIDPYFKDFHDFARKRGIEIAVLSDGLDYYIEQILVRFGLAEIEFFANRLAFKNGSFEVQFPWHDLMECTDCGCCKMHHVQRYRDGGYFIVYVGDGLSDRCPCEGADMVFAKGDLLRHCQQQHIDHIEFRNFRDVEREVVQRLVLDDAFPGE